MFEMVPTARDSDEHRAVPAASIAVPHAELRTRLRAFAARVLGVGPEHPDAEDCAQEALSRWLSGSTGEQGPGFVFGIARNVALDHLRRRSRRRENLVGAPDSENDLGRLASAASSPEEQSHEQQRNAGLLRALDQLPDNQRRALRMFYLEQLPYDAIAKRLGVSTGTVATWLSRGKAQLADHLRRSQS